MLLTVSAVRTFIIANLARGGPEDTRRLVAWYAITGGLGVVTVVLAEVLAHG